MAIVGRDVQWAEIESLLAARSGGLLLTGEPGIGKTVLWEAGVRQAQSDAWRVLAHRSVEAEAGLAFAGLSDLVAPVFDEVADALVAPRRRALEVALLLAEPRDTPPDARLLGLALLDVLRALASDEAPVLVALDDVQWLDASSGAVVAIALRRLGTAPVAALATRRTPSGEPIDHELFEGHLTHVALPPLDITATGRLIRDGLGYELRRPALASIHRVSGGNPFFATELARAGADADDVRVPASLRALLGGRIARLPEPTQNVLLDAAALARPTVDLLDGQLEALDVAVLDGIVRVDGSTIRFTHPLLASIAYDRAPPGKRRAVHARLAERVTDPEECARHRALAAGEVADAELALELDQAASHAAARGAPAAAAELEELASRHTPSDDVDARQARRRAAARFHRVSGDTERAAELCRELIRELPAGQDRAELLYESALSEHADSSTAIALCRQALAELDRDDALASRALGYIAINRWMIGDVRGGLEDARASLASAERDGDPVLVATAIARVSPLEAWTLEVTPGLLERGVELERALPELLWIDDSPSWVLAVTLTLNDALAEASAVLADLVASAERRGDEVSRGMHLIAALILERHKGHLDRALEYAEAAFEHAERFGDMVRPSAYGWGAQVLADLGRDEQASATIDRGLQLVDPLDEDRRSLLLGARGRLALSRGDLATARAALDGVVERALRAGILIPGARPWPETVETLIALGELERAANLLATFEELAERSSRWARATSARSRGLLLLAHGEVDRAVAAMERSLEEEGGTYPLERGRTLLALGAAHRRARRSRLARESLGRAVAVFEEIGAAAWCKTAQLELGRISGRRAPDESLTDAELRVAELAAQGRQNKEIAATLFLGVSTVEMHLSRTYRKLGVRSRTELANALSRSEAP